MSKSYQKYLLIGLSAISISLIGMEKDQQRSQLKQSDSNTLVLQPLGGYIALHEYCRDDIRSFYKDNAIEKTIHFTPMNNDTRNPIYKFLKDRLLSAVPLNLFIETDKTYTLTDGNNTFTIVSDRVYDEKEFDTYKNYWNTIHNKNNQ